jgi:hypothetical protein
MNDPQAVALHLGRSEALVLYEFLARTAAARAVDPLVLDQAELRVLWDLEAILEKALADVVAADYKVRLALARDEVRDGSTG